MTPAQQSALLTAARAQIDSKTGHTFDCGHCRETWGGVTCIGACCILRAALATTDDDGETSELTPVGKAPPGYSNPVQRKR